MFKVRCVCEGEIQEWTLEAVIYEINRDRSEHWTDYDETDWEEGWNSWIEEDGFYSMLDVEGNKLNQ